MDEYQEYIENCLWETNDVVWFYDLIFLYLREPQLFKYGRGVLMEQAVGVLADTDANGELAPNLTDYALKSLMWRYMYITTKNDNSVYGYYGV